MGVVASNPVARLLSFAGGRDPLRARVHVPAVLAAAAAVPDLPTGGRAPAAVVRRRLMQQCGLARCWRGVVLHVFDCIGFVSW